MAKPSSLSLALTVREHDAALGGLIRANPLAILVVDADDRVQMVNPAFEVLFGFRESELVGHPIDAFIVPQERTAEAAGLSQRGFAGQTARSVTQRRRKDGALVDIDLTVVPLATGTAGRHTVGAYGIFRDLTEQKRAERHLRAQYAVIEALANSATIEGAATSVLRSVAEALQWQCGVMWLVDKTANELRCVDCWCSPEIDAAQFDAETRQRRFARGVGPGRTWDIGRPNWISDVTTEPAFSRHTAAVAAGLHAAFSLPMVLDNDIVGVLEFFTRSILDSDDQILRMFDALGRQLGDFIGRTRAQEQLERFFTMSGDLLSIAGFDGYFTRVNESWHRTLGYTTTEIMSHRCSTSCTGTISSRRKPCWPA
jgi:PAS domain S-box-containing protein